MVDILPFRGLRYNLPHLAQQGASLNEVTTPPYDVIDPAQQTAFYQRHPANFIRLDLPRQHTDDHAQHNVYTRARDHLNQWESEGILRPDPRPAFYAYAQSWLEDGGQRIERTGMIGLLRLEPFEDGRVLPHEHTLKGPKADRMQLLQHSLTGMSQVFFIYSDPDRLMERLLFDSSRPEADWAQADDPDGVQHRLRVVDDPAIVEPLQALFQDKTLLIADGHHRYETALAFQAAVRQRIQEQSGHTPPPGSLLSDYAMVFLTNMDDPGLKVYPTHRILYHWPDGWTQDRFETALYNQYEPTTDVDPAVVFRYRPAGSSQRQPVRRRPDAPALALPPLLDRFDAALLAESVFQGILGASQEQLKNEHLLGFYRNEAEIDRLWADQQAVAGFYLQAPSVQLVHDICQSGQRMPQKSTYFYPKILSGLVLLPYRPFLDGSGHALDHHAHTASVPAHLDFPGTPFTLRPY